MPAVRPNRRGRGAYRQLDGACRRTAVAPRRDVPKAFKTHNSRRIRPSFKSRFALLRFSNNLNSCGPDPNLANCEGPGRSLMMRLILHGFGFAVCTALLCPAPGRAGKLEVPPAASEVIERIYSGDLPAGLEGALRLERENPDQPIGYLLEAEAIWWRIWCTSAEFKYGMTYPRHRAKLAADQHYLDLAAKVSSLADAEIAARETAEAHFYAGMGDALAARLYGLRGDNRAAARHGVRGREQLLRAIALDSTLADADLGLGLYNYYADTLSGIARVLRFFMGIPGGSKQEGIRQLEHAIADGTMSPAEARFYLAISLHNYDQKYEQALEIAKPLVEKYPSNSLFQLIVGDLYAKLGRHGSAAEHYRAAAGVPVTDAECRDQVQALVRASLTAIKASPEGAPGPTN
jgi:tetratricopeptide (TPR) repeat protein